MIAARLMRLPTVAVCLTALACSSTSRPEAPRDASGVAGSSGTAGGTAGAGGSTAGAGDATAGAGGATAGAGGAAAGAGGTSGASGGDGGAATDAGSSDTGVPHDAPSEHGAAGCAAALCESFDGVAPGKTGSPWAIDVDTKGTVVETVSNKGRTDTHSLHVKVSAMSGVRGYITETQSLAATGASFWGRVFLWYAVDTAGVHIVNVAVDGKATNGTTEQVRIVNAIGNHVATNRRSDDMGKGSNVVPPQGKWSCYEWHITPSTLDVYLDGAMLPISETWVEPPLALLRVGFERFAAGATGEVWLDDVAVDSARVGCD